jgi:hypothetical protein
MFDQTPIKASVEIDKFIRHTITNLEGALEKQSTKLTLAVLTNIADTIESYIEPLYLSALCDKIDEREENDVIHYSP